MKEYPKASSSEAQFNVAFWEYSGEIKNNNLWSDCVLGFMFMFMIPAISKQFSKLVLNFLPLSILNI